MLNLILRFLYKHFKPNDNGDEFLARIITVDETWVAHITPETKQ